MAVKTGAITGDGDIAVERYVGASYPNGWNSLSIVKAAGSATISLQMSEDGTTWVTVKDINGTDLSASTTANLHKAFRSRGAHYRIHTASSSGLTARYYIR